MHTEHTLDIPWPRTAAHALGVLTHPPNHSMPTNPQMGLKLATLGGSTGGMQLLGEQVRGSQVVGS